MGAAVASVHLSRRSRGGEKAGTPNSEKADQKTRKPQIH
jgi:hypothetical protein